MTIINDVINEVNVWEFIEQFGDFISQNILVWSKFFRNFDVNTLKDPDWKRKHSYLVLKQVRDFLMRCKEFLSLNPPKNLEKVREVFTKYDNLPNIDVIEFYIICGIRTIQVSKVPMKLRNFNWVKYIAIRDSI
jgi:hypothetical protein